MRTLSITRPDDWHVHLRDGTLLEHTARATAAHFARALVMPNVQPPLTSVAKVLAYREHILKATAGFPSFTPYMSLYLNESVTPLDLIHAKNYPEILGAKFYPAGATTHSEQGAASIKHLYPLLEVMQAHDLVLQIHGEVTHGDIFERETLFLDEYLTPLIQDFPKLRIVLEHISTRAAVAFVLEAPQTVAATITPHHILYNRNQMLVGGIKPHFYCLPILKDARDQSAVQQAAVSGNAKFFAGTDSAPHAQAKKECASGCAGIYSAPFAVALYAQLFESLGHLAKLNDFLSTFGADFYQLPKTHERIELVKTAQIVPDSLPLGSQKVIPIAAGTTLQWSIHEPT